MGLEGSEAETCIATFCSAIIRSPLEALSPTEGAGAKAGLGLLLCGDEAEGGGGVGDAAAGLVALTFSSTSWIRGLMDGGESGNFSLRMSRISPRALEKAESAGWSDVAWATWANVPVVRSSTSHLKEFWRARSRSGWMASQCSRMSRDNACAAAAPSPQPLLMVPASMW